MIHIVQKKHPFDELTYITCHLYTLRKLSEGYLYTVYRASGNEYSSRL